MARPKRLHPDPTISTSPMLSTILESEEAESALEMYLDVLIYLGVEEALVLRRIMGWHRYAVRTVVP